MISQMVRNESVIFGRHIAIEISYKILQLEVPKLVPILHYPACFQKGLFEGNFEQKHPQAFTKRMHVLSRFHLLEFARFLEF
jgi:hypothetical protein